jgi:hypothetical protein
MESPIITIGPPKNLNIRCHNVSKPLNNRLNTLIGNSIVLPKARSFITMLPPGSLLGNFQIKSKFIKEN